MFRLPHRDDALALRLEDLASSLDAGLNADAVLDSWPTGASSGAREAAAGLQGDLVDAMVRRGLQLDATERSVLAAAETSGNLPAALRGRAAARRQRAALIRELWSRLRYPCLLAIMASVVAVLAGPIVGTGLSTVAALALPTALIGGWWLGRILVRRADFTGAGVPGLRPILQDAAEMPYLEAMAGLYGAGVPILEAHTQALRTVAVASVRARLFRAQQILERDATPLTEALTHTQALATETLQILTPAEQAGQLEDALRRALERRRHTFAVRAGAWVRWIGAAVYGAVVVLVAWVVIEFYSGLYGGFLRR